jgi:DNA polymerase-3 subunit gamma/tau
MVFEDVIGQAHVSTTLRNAIASDRLSHAYIFSGPRGCGKTTTARILAKAINCLHPLESNPDNTCELCTEITEGRSVNVFEIDGASNRGIEDIRNLREAVRYPPAKGKYKVYIIDEVHMLTKEAFNALLKTLEEPPPHVLFIFATTEIQKVPATILSRCQRFDFRRNTIADITGRLGFIAKKEKISIDDDSLLLIAKKGDGSMRDAQSIFDQIVSFCGMKITHDEIVRTLNLVDEELYFRVTDCINNGDAPGALALVEEIINRGYDLREFLAGLNEHFRNILVVLTTGSGQLVEAPEAFKKRYQDEASRFTTTDLLRLIKVTMDTDGAIRWSSQPRTRLEVALLQMVKMEKSIQIDRLLTQLDDLKKKVSGGLPAEPARRQQLPLREEPSGAPIRGSVKASQPVLKPEQVVPDAEVLPESRPAKARPVMAPAPPPPAESAEPAGLQVVSLSTEDALGKWSQLLTEARQEKIAVGIMLGETKFAGIEENRVRVNCPDDFHLEQFKRNREYLNQLAQRVYGAKVRLEGTLADITAAGQTGHETDHAASSKQSELRKHPVVQAIIREFGAREIE